MMGAEVLSDPEMDGPEVGAITVLRRGLEVSPELRDGLLATALMALATAAGRVIVPILIQQILDKGITGPEGLRPGFVLGAGAIAVATLAAITVGSRVTYLRLVRAAELALANLRTRVFEHVHRLSLAEQTGTRRGILVSRVTSDIDTLAQFAQWGAVAWIVDTAVIVGCLLVMAAYSWQLALVTLFAYLPLIPVMRLLQQRQLRAYDEVRTRVGETLGEVSESVMGAQVIRAYGYVEPTRGRLARAVDRWYRAQMRATLFFSTIFALGDVFGGVALAAVVGVGAWMGPDWGLDLGGMVAVLFLATLILTPVQSLGEVLDQTQTAIAGWRKVIAVLDLPVELVEPQPGTPLPAGALSVRVEQVGFAYRTGGPVLVDVDLDIPAGTTVAVVGETGSGKTTLAKLLCRLADPSQGRILVAGVDLRDVAPDSRHERIRMVPQDGFLFDASLRDNLLMARPGATDDELREAFASVDLGFWLARLPDGLDTQVGERGENLSVGERQLVALARAHVSSPGLLVLDEATSSVDPETEQAVARALAAMAREGRPADSTTAMADDSAAVATTTSVATASVAASPAVAISTVPTSPGAATLVVIAHRLSTAELADVVVVMDQGRVVEVGSHADLVHAGGVYSALYTSWLGNTRAAT